MFSCPVLWTSGDFVAGAYARYNTSTSTELVVGLQPFKKMWLVARNQTRTMTVLSKKKILRFLRMQNKSFPSTTYVLFVQPTYVQSVKCFKHKKK